MRRLEPRFLGAVRAAARPSLTGWERVSGAAIAMCGPIRGLMLVPMRGLMLAPMLGLMLGASSSSAARRPMVEQDLYHLVWVADPQISPDGSRVAFVRVVIDSAADEYRTALWLVDAAGGTPRPLTSGGR